MQRIGKHKAVTLSYRITDGNHPLAGQDVTFLDRAIEVRDAMSGEFAAGRF